MGETSGAGTAHLSRVFEFIQVINGINVTQSFSVVFCWPLFIIGPFSFNLFNVFSVLWVTASDYPFGTFKL